MTMEERVGGMCFIGKTATHLVCYTFPQSYVLPLVGADRKQLMMKINRYTNTTVHKILKSIITAKKKEKKKKRINITD